MPKELSALDVLEVSVVPKGANRKKFFLIKEDNSMDPKKLAALLSKEAPKTLADFIAKAEHMTEDQKAAALALGRLLSPAMEGMDEEMKVAFMKSLGFPAVKEDPKPEDKPEDKPEETNKADKPGTPEISKEDRAKLPVEVQKALDVAEAARVSMQKELAAIQEVNKGLAADLKAQKEAKVLADMTAIAKEFTNLAQPTEKLAQMLKSAKERGEDEFKTLVETLRGANTVANPDAFGELGKSGGDDTTDPWDQIEKEADRMIEKSDASDNLTKAQAITKVLETEKGKRLYARHEAMKGPRAN